MFKKIKANKFNIFRLLCLVGYILSAIVLIVESCMDGASSSAQSNAVGGTIAGIVNNVGGDDTKVIIPTDVKINNEITQAYVGKTHKLEVETLPKNATFKANDFYSSNNEIAEISPDGLITFLSEGEVTITVINHDYSEISSSFVIEVNNIDVSDINVAINATATDDVYTLYIDETYKLSTIISPNDATIKDVTYSLDTSSYISIDKNGNITPLAYSKNNITKIKVNCGNIEKEIKVKVEYKDIIKLADYSLSSDFYEIYVGQSKRITVSPIPVDATFTDYTLASSDTSIASITNKNTFKGVKEGSVTLKLTSTTYENIYKTITVNVLAKPEITSFNVVSEVSLIEGSYHTIKLSNVKPSYADTSKITYSSSNTEYVTVTKSGKIYAKKTTISDVIVYVTIGSITKEIKVKVTPYLNEEIEEIDSNTIGFEVSYLQGDRPLFYTNTNYDLSTYYGVSKFITLDNNEPKDKKIAYSSSSSEITISENNMNIATGGYYEIAMIHTASGKTNVITLFAVDNYDISLSLSNEALVDENTYNVYANSSFTLTINAHENQLQRYVLTSSSTNALINEEDNNHYIIEVANTASMFTLTIDCYFDDMKIDALTKTLNFNASHVLIESIDVKVTNSENELLILDYNEQTSHYEFDMFVNEIFYVSHSITPKSPSLSSIVYISSNEDVLTINNDGLLVVKGIGKATITIKDEITNLEKSIDVTISNKILLDLENTITFKGEDAKYDSENDVYSLLNGHSGSIKLNFLEESTYTTVTYSSSDEKIISVSGDGTLTPKKKGEATITLICNDGMQDEIKIEIKVKVEPQPVIKDLSAFFYKIRKSLGHFGAFLVLGIFSTFTFLLYFRKWKWLFSVPLNIALGFGLAALTEYIQTFVPGRYGCWSDIMIDFSGFMSSAVFLTILILLIYFIKFIRKIINMKKGETANG